MSALRMEKQLGRILDFSHKEHSRVARINYFSDLLAGNGSGNREW